MSWKAYVRRSVLPTTTASSLLLATHSGPARNIPKTQSTPLYWHNITIPLSLTGSALAYSTSRDPTVHIDILNQYPSLLFT
ncbi:hypothetical protein C8J57DRAFT_1720178 [Mycena rebaudengoi]|nr:hypothetical protein C8J57DRAFT_1720178 [Mycena rebaudengoi]